jgi:penicillin-binding protein 1A
MVVIVLTGVLVGELTRVLAVPLHQVATRSMSGTPQPVGDLEELDQPSIVYDTNGVVLTTFKAEVNRKPVTLDQVPVMVRTAILDVEDNSFYTHGGIDLKSVARAFFTNSTAGAVRQGGSTITQQVVKNSLLGPERTIDRKIKEAVLATRLEQKMTKDQILERYLNLVYFGNGVYGVEAAAEAYFDKPVGQLQPEEAAFLAGVIRNPLGYDPLKNPQAAIDRRNVALQRMVDLGHLSPDEAKPLMLKPVPTHLSISDPVRQSYFIEDLQQSLLDDPRLGSTPAERYNAVFRGGLQIFSTFDPATQAEADQDAAVGTIVPQNRIGAIAAMAAVEPATGYVRAVVGGSGFDKFKYDIATHAPGRQPGSSFKLFTLLSALEAGYGPQSTVDGSGPCQVIGYGSSRRRPQLIQNSEGPGGGDMTMESATAGSVNCAFERMAATVGLDKVVEMAKRLGLKKKYDAYPSVVIGSEEATPLEMASAYSTLANDGVRHAPTYVVKVLDSHGNVLFNGADAGVRVLTPAVSRTAVSILQTVLTSGTAAGNSLRNRESAGKTGTTNTYTNAWFVGFTPQLATAVWMGVPNANVPMTNVGGRRVFGATYSAPVWKRFMDAVLADQPAVAFPNLDPRQTIRSRPFNLPRNSFISSGSGGAPSSALSSNRTPSKPTTPRATAPASTGAPPTTGVTVAPGPPTTKAGGPPTTTKA